MTTTWEMSICAENHFIIQRNEGLLWKSIFDPVSNSQILFNSFSRRVLTLI